MVDHVVEIGWTPLTPEVALKHARGTAGMLFPSVLEGKLREFNPWLSESALDRSLTAWR
jgi:type I restriction enzyme R subunit